nr:MAG TPA: Organic solute transport protein 1 [Caudoviricetes sp.]
MIRYMQYVLDTLIEFRMTMTVKWKLFSIVQPTQFLLHLQHGNL